MNASLAKFYLIAKLQADTTLDLAEILLLKRHQINLNKKVIHIDNQTISIQDEMILTLLKVLLSLNIQTEESYLFIN